MCPIVQCVPMSYSVSYFRQVREPLFTLQAWWRRHLGFAQRIQREGIQEQAFWGPVSLKGSGSAHRPFLLQRGLRVRMGACVCGCARGAWRSRSLTGALLRGEDMCSASFWLENVFLHLGWRRGDVGFVSSPSSCLAANCLRQISSKAGFFGQLNPLNVKHLLEVSPEIIN